MFGFEVKAERFTSLRTNNALIAHSSISLQQALCLSLWLAVRKSILAAKHTGSSNWATGNIFTNLCWYWYPIYLVQTPQIAVGSADDSYSGVGLLYVSRFVSWSPYALKISLLTLKPVVWLGYSMFISLLIQRSHSSDFTSLNSISQCSTGCLMLAYF